MRRSACLALALILLGVVSPWRSSAESGSTAAVGESAEVAPFPCFDRLRIDFPLRSADWTMWPDVLQTPREYRIGHPFEIAPFRYDFVEISSNPSRLKIQPHYDKSTWDSFYVDTDGAIRVTAFGGLFPFTMGKQSRLLEGVLCTLSTFVVEIRPEHPETASKIDQIIDDLTQRMGDMMPGPWPPAFDDLNGWTGIRGGVARSFWRWKLGSKLERPFECSSPGL